MTMDKMEVKRENGDEGREGRSKEKWEIKEEKDVKQAQMFEQRKSTLPTDCWIATRLMRAGP